MPRERLGELLQSLQRGTLRLTRLIDNLLESVRIESGQLGIRHQPVSLAQVVEDAEDLMAGLLTQRRQVLRIAIPADLPQITGDAPRLTQVVTNLLANANKYGPEDSEISVGAARKGRPGRALDRGRRSRRAGARGHVDLRALLPRCGSRAGSARPRPRPLDRQVDRRAPRRRGSRGPHAGRHARASPCACRSPRRPHEAPRRRRRPGSAGARRLLADERGLRRGQGRGHGGRRCGPSIPNCRISSSSTSTCRRAAASTSARRSARAPRCRS